MCNNILYFITHGAYKPNKLIAYDVIFDRWKQINVTMPRLLLYAYLVIHHGHLLMVGGLGSLVSQQRYGYGSLTPCVMIGFLLKNCLQNCSQSFLVCCHQNILCVLDKEINYIYALIEIQDV
jgi:hypothetical protein